MPASIDDELQLKVKTASSFTINLGAILYHQLLQEQHSFFSLLVPTSHIPHDLPTIHRYPFSPLFLYQQSMQQSEKISALREWMVAKGCKIHPSLTIPANINGIQGVATNQALPPKTLIVAVPANLILTVTRCYNDPALKKLFLANDDLFDYEATEDAEFNVLCVFLMYHKLNLEKSQWRAYLQTIAEPQTAVDWQDQQLKGLNKSMIEEIIHVRIECLKLQVQLVAYLMKRKEFQQYSKELLCKIFHYCYRAVMTRCFGYYFNEACLIPIADLINHGCQAVDHQLLNVNFQKEIQFQEGYYPRKDKMDCEILGIKGPEKRLLPFRERFLVDNNIVEDDLEKLAELDREKIDRCLYEWNSKRLKEGEKVQNLHFCSEDQEEDNDTDEEFEVEQIRELQYCRKNEEMQMKEFMESFVTVERYVDVERKLEELEGKEANVQEKGNETDKQVVVKEEVKQSESSEKVEEKVEENATECKEETVKETTQAKQVQTTKSKQLSPEILQKPEQAKPTQPEPTAQIPQPPKAPTPNPFSNSSGRGVPIQRVESSEQQSEDQEQWGLKQGSYFTMSTSSPVAANRELFNSYGSRTNKFLLIWYGFCYPNNLYDSVTVRLQVQFGSLRPAKEIVLDSYIGGQGLSFKKPNLQVVKEHQISREFRFKRNNISQNLLTFLRLYMMNYYKGQDLYKLFVTFPSSNEFQLFVFKYYREIIEALYERYPLEGIQVLKKEMDMPEYQSIRFKIRYKVIYLEEQRKLLDLNLRAANVIIEMLEAAKANGGVLEERMYASLPIQVLRMVRKYLISYTKNKEYILYTQADLQSFMQKKAQASALKQPLQPQPQKQPQSSQQSWSSQSSSQQPTP